MGLYSITHTSHPQRLDWAFRTETSQNSMKVLVLFLHFNLSIRFCNFRSLSYFGETETNQKAEKIVLPALPTILSFFSAVCSVQTMMRLVICLKTVQLILRNFFYMIMVFEVVNAIIIPFMQLWDLTQLFLQIQVQLHGTCFARTKFLPSCLNSNSTTNRHFSFLSVVIFQCFSQFCLSRLR